MELGSSSRRSSSGGLTKHVNKVHHVTTINRVAEDLGEDPDWLFDVAVELDVEDGVVWVYGVNDDGVPTFTDFGIENLTELIRFYRDESLGGPSRMDTFRHYKARRARARTSDGSSPNILRKSFPKWPRFPKPHL